MRSWQIASVGGVDGGECDAPVKLVFGADVENFKRRIDPLWDATNAAVSECASLSPATKEAWARQYREWKALVSSSVPLFGAHGQWVNLCAHAKILDAWRDKLEKTTCEVVGPNAIKGYEFPSSMADVFRYLAYGAIGLGAIGLMVYLAPEIKSALRARRDP